MKRTLLGITMVMKILISFFARSIKTFIRKVNKFSIVMVGEQIDSYFLTTVSA